MFKSLCFSAALLLFWGRVAAADDASRPYPPPAEVRAKLLAQLDRPRVPLDPQVTLVEPGEAGLIVERLTIASERKADGQIERVPILIVRPKETGTPRPLVIFLHGTGGNKESQVHWLVRVARLGMIGLAIDARYHGQRAGGATGAAAYVDAITAAWRVKPGQPQEHPFYFDTVWDLWRVLDYVGQRPDVDPRRVAMVGFSMGGIQTWLAAAVDQRVAVAVPAISVQSFRWSLDHDRWQGRANTISGAHRAAAEDLGEPEVNQRVCRVLWNKVIPGILDDFDCPSMLRLFADRPLLIVSGELDPNCPLEGARIAFAAAEQAYKEAGASDRLQIDVAEGVAHHVTGKQEKLIADWLVRWLQTPEKTPPEKGQ
ncbi:MAG TPA: alpha/beta fold hydrolase [Pirellulales bacterium]|jgi:dienelactone hydrolase|nr:alpha/beta fold hydrolase [Pirellulales bacterium]